MFSVTVIFCLVSLQRHILCSDFTSVLKSSDFMEIRQTPFFVDKTLLISKTIDNDEPLLLTAPPGFGKSTNLDMIRVFLSNAVDRKVAEAVFADTYISKDNNPIFRTHLGSHPVIYCSFEPTSSVTDYNTMVENFRTSLHKAFLQHQYLVSSKLLAIGDLDRFNKFIDADSCKRLEPSEVFSGLHFLSEALTTHHNKQVILLIDDYDSLIWESVMTQSIGIKEVLEFYDAVLSKVLIDNKNVKKSILTGTSCLLFKLLPGSANTKCVKWLHDNNFEPFFGLTGDEVDHLVGRTVYVSLRPNLTEWYDGYTSPDLTAHIYNTRSVLSFLLLSKGQLTSYWENLKVQKSLRILLEDSVRKNLLLESPEKLMFVVQEVKEVNERVLEGVKNMINQEIWDADVSDLYIHLLMERGYFTFDKRWERSGYNSSVTLRLANRDVCEYLKQFTVDFIDEMKRLSSNMNIV